MAWMLLFAILLVTYVFIPGYIAVRVFLAGAREPYLGRFPVIGLVGYTFGIALIVTAAEWFRDDPDPRPLSTKLALAGLCFLAGCVIWLGGFFFGRWRGSKREGILKG